MTNLLRHISLLIVVLFIGNGNLWGQTFDPDDCPRGPLVRIPITSLTKAPTADYMLLTDSCGNQYYTLKDSTTVKGSVINQVFQGDSLITILQGGDTVITVINMQGDTSMTGRFRWADNLGDQDTTYTYPAGTPTDNVNVTNGLSIDSGANTKLKLGGRLIETTTVTGSNYTYNMRWDSINILYHFVNSTRIYPKQAFIVQSDNSPTMYVDMRSPTSMYMRADSVLQLDLSQHGFADTSHLLIRTDRARDGRWVKGGFLQLLRTSAGIHQGEADWSLYAMPLAVPDSSGNYVLNYDSGSKTFDWAEESGGGGGGVGGSGTLNYVAKWTPDGNTLGDGLIYFDPGYASTVMAGPVGAPSGFDNNLVMTSANPGLVFNSTSAAGYDVGLFVTNGTLYFRQNNFNNNAGGGYTGEISNTGKWSIGKNGTEAGTALIVHGPGNTSATNTQKWKDSSGTELGWMRDNGHLYSKNYLSVGTTANIGTVTVNGFYYDTDGYVLGNGNFAFYKWNPNSGYLTQPGSNHWAWKTTLGDMIFGINGDAVQTLTANGTARITGSVDTANVIHLWGSNAEGDLKKINLGSDVVIQGDSVYIVPPVAELEYWTESEQNATQASTVWEPKNGTNVNAVIEPLGTGALIAGPAPDGTSTGGNARGTRAIDLQLSRSAANHVASGAHSVAIGNLNRASGQFGIGIGYDVDATGVSSVAIGVSTQSTSTQSIAIGDGAVASGVNAIALGANSLANAIGSVAMGPSNEARGLWSLASGKDGEAHLFGQRAHSSTGFATEGDNQTSDLRAWRTIVGTTPRDLLVDGSSAKIVLTVGGGNPNSRVWNARIQVIASTTDTGNGSGTFGDTFIGNYEVGIKNILGTTSLVGSGVITNSIAADAGMAGASVAITANNADDSLDITFTPPTSAGSTTETYVTATVYLTEMAY